MDIYNENQKQTIYDGKDDYKEVKRDSRESPNNILLVFIILLGLAVCYIINNCLWLVSVKNILEKDGRAKVITKFNIFKNEQLVKDQLLNESRTGVYNVSVALMFSKFERIHLYYFSKRNNVPVDLGFMLIWTQAGINEVKLYGPDIVKLSWYGNYKFTYFGNSLLNQLFLYYKEKLVKKYPKNIRDDLKTAFVTIPYDTVTNFKIIFSIYFFIPLIIIIIMVGKIGKVMYISLGYYIIMSLFYNVKNLYYSSTFSWIFSLFKIKPPTFLPIVFVVVVLLTVVYFIWKGIQSIPHERLSFEKVCYILFFILLPLVLRF